MKYPRSLLANTLLCTLAISTSTLPLASTPAPLNSAAPISSATTDSDDVFNKVIEIRQRLQMLQDLVMRHVPIQYQQIILRQGARYSQEQREHFYKWLTAINKAIQEHYGYFESYKEQELLYASQFLTTLINIHLKAIASDLQTLPEVSFVQYTPRTAIPTVQSLEKKVADVQQLIEHQLIPALTLCGMSLTERVSFWWNISNARFGITRKIGYGVATFFAIGLIRYFTKTRDLINLQGERARADEIANKPENTCFPDMDIYIPTSIKTAKQYIASFFGNRTTPTFIQFIDNVIIGAPQEQMTASGPMLIGHRGCFGFIHRHSHSALMVASTPLAVAAYLEVIKQKSNDWRLLFNNPAHFFGIGTPTGTPVKHEQMNFYFEAVTPSFGFDHIIGLEQVKVTLRAKIDATLTGQTSTISACLLYGPPGCGKTQMARAVAGEMAQLSTLHPVIFLKTKTLVLNKTTFLELLEAANAIYPGYQIVLFIDEIDMYQPQRNTNVNNLIDLVETLSGVNSERFRHIFVLAATNRADLLDDALIRHGRFGDVIVFEKPSFSDRYAYFEAACNQHGLAIDTNTLVQAAQATSMCAFSDLNAVFEKALHIAFKEMAEQQAARTVQEILEAPPSLKIEYRHIRQALDHLIHRIHGIKKPLPAYEQRVVALHLAGQVLTNALLDTKQLLYQATILPVQRPIQEQALWGAQYTKDKTLIHHGGIFFIPEPDSAGYLQAQHLIAQAKTLLAGFIAEEIGTDSTSGYQYRLEDRDRAFTIIEKLKLKGIAREQLTDTLRTRIIDEVYIDIMHYEQELRALLQEHKHELVTLANHLEEHSFITPEDVVHLVKAK